MPGDDDKCDTLMREMLQRSQQATQDLIASSTDRRAAATTPLVAANRSSIDTFGTKSVSLHFDGLRMDHRFHVAVVSRPILGADFCLTTWSPH